MEGQQKAFSLLGSPKAKEALDVSRESEPLRKKYSETLNGTSMLFARRLVEAGVPFVTVFWNEDPGLKSKCKSAGGIRGRQAYGTSDKVTAYPDVNPAATEDIAKTAYYAMGVDDIVQDGPERGPAPILTDGAPLFDLF